LRASCSCSTNRPAAGALDVAKEFSVEGLVVDHKKFTGDRGAHEREIVRVLASRKIDIVVLAGYMRVLSGALLDVYEGRTINIHPSLLPAYPGAHAQRDALAAGAKLSGCTVHFVTSDLDAGPIILQRSVPVEEDDTENSLSARILEQEHIALPEALAPPQRMPPAHRWAARDQGSSAGGHAPVAADRDRKSAQGAGDRIDPGRCSISHP
jgi:phosphoribosylglycinamide formyltransferase-1